MLHESRIWGIHPASHIESLARDLTQFTWTCCTAFLLGDYIFANDSTSADGAQEYAVLRDPGAEHPFVQIESITFSWCDENEAIELISRVLAGNYDGEHYGKVQRRRLQTRAEHKTCHLCA